MTRWDSTITPAALDELAGRARRSRPEIGDGALTLIGEGISTLTYGWPPPGDAWVLRVSRQHPTPWTWRGGRAHEVALLAELERRGLPVAADAMVIEEVDGLPAAILERRVTGKKLDGEHLRTKPELLQKIAEMLDRLHSIDPDHAVARTVPRDDPTGEFRQALAGVDLGDDGLRRRVETALVRLEERSEIRTLCHRDFRVEHLIVGEDWRFSGLLDLGEVGIDDPAVDLAFLHGELGAETVQEICAAMETADAGLAAAAATFHALWPLLELAPGGDWWGDPATARDRLAALV